MANHRIERIDGLVGHGQRRAAEREIEERRDDPVAKALSKSLDDGTANLGFVEVISIAANDTRQTHARAIDVSVLDCAENLHGLVEQVPGGKTTGGEPRFDYESRKTLTTVRAPHDYPRDG